MSGVHHRQEMKFTLLLTQQLSALVHENILEVKAKCSTYSQAVTVAGTLVSCKQSSLCLYKRGIFIESFKQPGILQSFL